jgi:hypothetical protein
VSARSETIEETSEAQPSEKNRDDGGTPGPARTLSGNRSGGREQREKLESNHRENRATGKEGESDHRRHKHSSWKRNGSTPVGYSGRIALRREHCGI